MAVANRTVDAALPVPESEPRTYLGSALRITVAFLRERGCLALVRQKVSPATAALIDKPPFPFAWIPAAAMDELESALLAIAGQQACADLGSTAARKLGGSVIAPVLRMASALFGNTPATLLGNLDRFYPMVLKGMSFKYEALGDREGLVRASAGGPDVPAALFHVTRGNLLFIFELCGVSGTVGAPEDIRCDARMGEAVYRVRWS
jgi:hypothetical protein